MCALPDYDLGGHTQDKLLERTNITTQKDISEVTRDITRTKELDMMRIAEASCALLDIPTLMKQVIECLSNTAAGKRRGQLDASTSIGIIIDPGMFGETTPASHIRKPPLREAACKAQGTSKHLSINPPGIAAECNNAKQYHVSCDVFSFSLLHHGAAMDS